MSRFSRVRGEAGFTLVEMLITLTLLGMVLTVVYKGLNTVNRTAYGYRDRLINLDEGRVLMATISKDLRTAARLQPDQSPFIFAGGRRATFYANLNTSTGPSRVNVYVDASNRLIEEVIAAAGTAPNYTYTSAPTVRVVGSFVANSGALFTYLDDEENPLLPPTSTTSLSAADLLKVSSVGIELAIRRTSRLATEPTTLINRVRLPNVDYNPIYEAN